MNRFAQKEKGPLQRRRGFPGPIEENLLNFVMLMAMAERSFKGMQDMLEKKGEELEKKEEEKQGPEGEMEEKRRFTIFYINPGYEKPKVEKVESSVEIKFNNPAEEKMNEALGAKSLFPAMEYVAYPMVQDIYSKGAVQEIMKSRKTEPIKGSEDVEIIDKFVTATPERITASVERREESQKIVEEMIVKVNNAKERIKEGERIERILPLLPPITRKMLEALMKKKGKLDKKTVLKILLSDWMFLNRMKRVLRSLDVKTLNRIAKAIVEGIIKEIKKR